MDGSILDQDMQYRLSSDGSWMPEPAPRRRRRARKVAWSAAVIATSIVAVGAWVYLANRDGRGTAPRHSETAAEAALEAARAAEAGRWASAELVEAEAHFTLARRERLRQDGRLPLFRDYRFARGEFRVADSLAGITEIAARERHEEARRLLRTDLDRALVAERRVRGLHRKIRPEPRSAAALRHASQHLRQAEAALANDDLEGAAALVGRTESDLESARGEALSLASRFVDEELVERWEGWVRETLAESRRSGDHAIIVYKEKNELILYRGGREVRRYHADMGSNKARDKTRAGDEATPEGRYKVTVRKDRGHSKYYRALEIDYPNEDDLARFQAAKRAGRIPAGAHPGGLIEIHGEGGRGQDWTRGCVALSNSDMDDLFPKIKVGTPVTIVGGDGRDGIFSRLVERAASEVKSGAR
jgi:hypothetical protein